MANPLDPNNPIPEYPTLEPTSALSFGDLITEVAYKIGVSYYGSDGTGAPQEPVDAHDLAICQRIVNKGVRKFIADGPKPNGWKWLNPVAQVDLWPQISYDPTATTYVNFTANPTINSVTYTGCTLLTLTTPNTPPPSGTIDTSYIPRFLQSMEFRQIWLNGNPPSGTPGWWLPVDEDFTGTLIGTPYTILFWVSDTQIVIDGLATGYGYPTNCPFSFACYGDYTLPANFSGQFTGPITYVANTNRGMILRWTDEYSIRSRRQNYNIESGTPYEAAVRLMPTPTYSVLTNTSGLMLPRRRWELMTWRISSEFLSILFPYTLAFNDLVHDTDVPPSPFSQDEALKACCLAVAEKEVDDSMAGPDWAYYHNIALPQAHSIDARSAPRAIGYVGNPMAAGPTWGLDAIRRFRNYDYQRPTVSVNSLS